MENILTWLVIIIGGGASLAIIVGLIGCMIGMFVYKVYRKFKYGMTLYD